MKDSELSKVLDEVEKDLGLALKAERDKLAKAHVGEATSAEVSPDMSATTPAPDASASAPAPAADAGSAPAPEASASGTMPSMGEGSSSSSGSSSSGSSSGSDSSSGSSEGSSMAEEGGMSHDALKAEYAKLDVEELKMHYMAAKEALAEKLPADDMGGAPAPDAAAPPAPAPSPDMGMGAPPPDMSAMKAEPKAERPLAKAEPNPEIETLKTQLAKNEQELASAKAAISALVGSVEKVLGQPVRKAVTSVAQVAFVAKTEEPKVDPLANLTRAEIKARLVKVAATPSLSKSDRSIINQFSLGSVGVEAIKHLLIEAPKSP